MSRKFIAAVLTAAVVLTGLTAAPVRAAENDALLRTLGIGTTLLVLGATIKNAKDKEDEDKKKKKHRYVERDPRPYFDDRGHYDNRGRHDDRGRYNNWGRYDHPGRGDEHRNYDNRGRFGHNSDFDNRGRRDRGHGVDFGRGRAPLPGSCLTETYRGSKVFDAVCLSRRYEQSRRLPDVCLSSVRTRHGQLLAYGANCLRNSGYTIARR
ncbi:hypothetical protein [Puniceibacterium confluentis]|uniref:hypothetical protein n=1 Tax=Puniceibacterium confluentis TaxID=1958944 RepID=UPI0011B7B6C2|nr:hypothetical protein [Puniceibacterium confluentis]